MLRRSLRPVVLGVVLVIAWALLHAAGCSDSTRPTADSQAGHQSHRSDLARDLSPAATADDLLALCEGNRELVLDLYRVLAAENENVLVSPLSIRMAFAMVYAGARGETATQMHQVLHYLLGTEQLHPAYNALELALRERNHPGEGDETGPVQLHVANAFWGRTGYPFLSGYLDLLAVNYGAGIEALDFSAAPEACRLVINNWVADRTQGRIEDLLPQGSIVSATVAVLTNAIYLKAPWQDVFPEELTADGPFHLLDGGSVVAPLMAQTGSYQYMEADTYQAIEIPCRHEELALVVILPAAGQFAGFEAGLTAESLEQILSDLSPYPVSLRLPRFSFTTSFRLKETLRGLGMILPFSSRAADFSGMVPAERQIWIDEAYHKTFIGVDEEGIEAAAATAIVMNETSLGAEFSADRPFLFLIRDRLTGMLLFMGRLLDPTAE